MKEEGTDKQKGMQTNLLLATGNGQLANTQCAQHAIKYAAKHQSKAKSSRATRNCKRCALVSVPCVCVWHCICVATCSCMCVCGCGCVWSVCQQLCCPLAPFASDSFIHCTLPVGHSRPSGCPTWPRPPSSLDCLSGRCRSAQTALAWPCITVAANQFESSGAHVKKKKESPKKRTTNFIFVAKTPLTAALLH